MGSLGRRLRKLLREQEGAVERYLMPDGQVWRFDAKHMSLAAFALAVSDLRRMDDLMRGEEQKEVSREYLALIFGVRIDAAGNPLDKEHAAYMKSGAYKSEGYTLLYPGHYGVLDFRRGEVERPDFETMDGADVGDIL